MCVCVCICIMRPCESQIRRHAINSLFTAACLALYMPPYTHGGYLVKSTFRIQTLCPRLLCVTSCCPRSQYKSYSFNICLTLSHREDLSVPDRLTDASLLIHHILSFSSFLKIYTQLSVY